MEKLLGRLVLVGGELRELPVNLRCDVNRLLGRVGVLGTLVNLHVGEQCAAEGALREHALHRLLNDAPGDTRLHLVEGLHLDVHQKIDQ
eukprot:312677-Prorocentrum_minimum.AAC.3